jgi:hypothetical protein
MSIPRVRLKPVYLEIPSSIARKATEVHVAAQGLTKCIEDFANYLASLPGKVETVLWIADECDANLPEELISGYLVKFHREGKRWTLSFDHTRAIDEGPPEYRPLVEAPLNAKLRIIEKFPDFLVKMEASQDELLEKIRSTDSRFREFLSGLATRTPKQEGE